MFRLSLRSSLPDKPRIVLRCCFLRRRVTCSQWMPGAKGSLHPKEGGRNDQA